MAANAKPTILAESRLLDGTPEATDTASGYDVLNIRDYRPYTFWVAASSGTKYITVDCGAAAAADALAVIGHNLYTADATVSVESSGNGSDWTERLTGFTPSSDEAFLKAFTSVSARYWRIKIVTAATAAEIAVAMIGSRLTFERYPRNNFDPAPEKVAAETARSKTGQLLGAVLKYVSLDVTVSFQRLTPSWVSDTFKPVWDDYLSQLLPFFWAWDITNHADEVYFAAIDAGFALKTPYDANRRSMTLRFTGIKE